MVFQRGIRVCFQLGQELRTQRIPFFRWSAWNGFGSQIALLSPLFEVSFDG